MQHSLMLPTVELTSRRGIAPDSSEGRANTAIGPAIRHDLRNESVQTLADAIRERYAQVLLARDSS